MAQAAHVMTPATGAPPGATAALAGDAPPSPDVVNADPGTADVGIADFGIADFVALQQRLVAQLDAVQRRLDTVTASLEAVRKSQAAYLGDHIACTYLQNGARILVDTRSLDVGIHLLFGGRWEPRQTRVFERMLFRGAGVLDVGANHGYYSLIAAPIVGPTGRVIAVEANPELARLIHHSFSINGYSPYGEVQQAAVGDSPYGTVELVVNPNLHGGAHIRPAVTKVSPMVGGAQVRHRVATTTIDALLGPERLSQINVVKMDIEGAEAAAFAGMRGLIAAARPLRMMIEFNGRSRAMVDAFRTHLPLLERESFAPLRIVHEGQLERMTWAALLESGANQDVVIARQDDHGWITVV